MMTPVVAIKGAKVASDRRNHTHFPLMTCSKMRTEKGPEGTPSKRHLRAFTPQG